MRSDQHFETPEDVDLGFKLAGPPARFGAYIVDSLLLLLIRVAVALLGLAIVVNLNTSVTAVQEEDFIDSLDGWVIAAFIILFFFSELLYFGLMEWRRNGSTPGKRYSGLRAVMDGGYRLTPTAAWLRNLVRPIDAIPLVWLVPLADKKNRRLGDFLAGTVVVTEQKAEAPILPLADQRYGDLAVRHLELSRNQLLQLRRKDYQALEEYLIRRRNIPASRIVRLQKILLAPILGRMELEMPMNVKPHEVLAEVYLALRDTPGLLDLLDD